MHSLRTLLDDDKVYLTDLLIFTLLQVVPDDFDVECGQCNQYLEDVRRYYGFDRPDLQSYGLRYGPYLTDAILHKALSKLVYVENLDYYRNTITSLVLEKVSREKQGMDIGVNTFFIELLNRKLNELSN